VTWPGAKMIFISYSWSDSSVVRSVHQNLRGSGHNVWIDFDSLDLSQPLEDQLRRAVYSASHFILIDSRRARSSRWVQREVEWAAHAGVPMVGLDVGRWEHLMRPNSKMHLTGWPAGDPERWVARACPVTRIMNQAGSPDPRQRW